MATMSHIGSGPIPGKIYTVLISKIYKILWNSRLPIPSLQELDWNPVTWDKAVNSPDGHYVYCAGKTFAEQAAWKFMELKKPCFDLISINPAWLIGPFLHQVDKPSNFNESLRECYENIMRKDQSLPPTIVQYWVDVRDAAKAHIMALEIPSASGRYLVVNGDKFDWKKVGTPFGNDSGHVKETS
jgi:NADPH-dependent methylglyoxal reductase